ncbi:DUF4265 domain-containing protein [Streptomyces nodosus]|uniref:DUF4265 domain-containing protein n=1 Tax=Streptomyces nodosus TaxID=40318 RepID=UPI00345518F2
MVDINDICGHPNPAWGDQADSLVMCDLTDSEMPGRWEQMWEKRLGDGRHMLCCIPFFASNIALGDIFTTASSRSVERSVNAVVERSGNVVIHAFFHDDVATAENEDRQGDLIGESVRLGIDYEVVRLGFVALSCPIGSHQHKEIERRLDAYNKLGWGHFVTSKSSG